MYTIQNSISKTLSTILSGLGISRRPRRQTVKHSDIDPDFKVRVFEAVSPQHFVPRQELKPIELEIIKGAGDPKKVPLPNPLQECSRIGYALVGLGHLSLEQILPAFNSSKKSKCVALVSASQEKMERVAHQYGIRKDYCYHYTEFDKLKDNQDVQAIYIILPNAMHAEYTIRGARAGKNVLVEKPMANSVHECKAMIMACREAQVKLMTAYRIQLEPVNRKLRELVQSNVFGRTRYIMAQNSHSATNIDHWRLNKELAGGGPLPDLGIYCINTSRFILGTEPTEVMAWTYSSPNNPIFSEVEEICSWQMKFPDGVIVNCVSDYNTHVSNFYRVCAERGWLQMENAYVYNGQELKTSHPEDCFRVETHLSIPPEDHFVSMIDHFSECIIENKEPLTPGEEGLQDQRIIEAIYKSSRERRPVKIEEVDESTNRSMGKDQFRGSEPHE